MNDEKGISEYYFKSARMWRTIHNLEKRGKRILRLSEEFLDVGQVVGLDLEVHGRQLASDDFQIRAAS
jgi:hypothetical protein